MTNKFSPLQNPIFASSAKRRMRSFRSPLLITLYCLFLAVVSATALLVLQQKSIHLSSLRVGIETHVYLSVMQFILIILVAPALTAGSIAGERERQTLDLLLCSRTGPFLIVTGKLFSSLLFITLLIITSFPMMAVMLLFGGIRFVDMGIMLLFLILTAFCASAVGIFCSAVFKRTVTATVVSYMIIFAIGAGTAFLPLLLQRSALSAALDYAQGYSPLIASTGGVAEPAMMVELLPKILLVNPAVGFFALLIEQTGMLASTFERYLGWRGNQVYSMLTLLSRLAWINMGMMLGCGIILTGVSALFVKPSGRKAKKK